MLEPVKATITMKGGAVSGVRAVDLYGVPTSRAVPLSGNTFTIDGRYQSFYYEIKRAGPDDGDGRAAAATAGIASGKASVEAMAAEWRGSLGRCRGAAWSVEAGGSNGNGPGDDSHRASWDGEWREGEGEAVAGTASSSRSCLVSDLPVFLAQGPGELRLRREEGAGHKGCPDGNWVRFVTGLASFCRGVRHSLTYWSDHRYLSGRRTPLRGCGRPQPQPPDRPASPISPRRSCRHCRVPTNPSRRHPSLRRTDTLPRCARRRSGGPSRRNRSCSGRRSRFAPPTTSRPIQSHRRRGDSRRRGSSPARPSPDSA